MSFETPRSRLIAALILPFAAACSSDRPLSVPGSDTLALNCPGVLGHVANVDGFTVIGHRGAAGEAVENTIPAMQIGIEKGATGVETDLCMTKDGEIVLWHDWDPNSTIALMRQAGKEPHVLFKPKVPPVGNPMRKPIDQLTLMEFREHYSYQTLDGDPVSTPIPSFGDFIAWAKSETRLQVVLLDIKVPEDKAELVDDLIDKTEKIMNQAGVTFHRVYMSPHKKVWERMSKRIPDSGLSFDVDLGVVPVSEGTCNGASSTRALKRGGGYATSVHPTSWGHEDWKKLKALLKCDLDARDKSHGRVAKVYAATIDEKDKMRCLMNMGVDGLVTNNPSNLEDIASWMHH